MESCFAWLEQKFKDFFPSQPIFFLYNPFIDQEDPHHPPSFPSPQSQFPPPSLHFTSILPPSRSFLNPHEHFSINNLDGNNQNSRGLRNGPPWRQFTVSPHRQNFGNFSFTQQRQSSQPQSRDDTNKNGPGLTTEEINQFPISKWKENNKKREKCVICQSEFEINEIFRTLLCFHLFHINCIDEWLKDHKKCPSCNQDMRDMLKRDYGYEQD